MATEKKWSGGAAGDEEKSTIINAFKMITSSAYSLLPIFSLIVLAYSGLIPFYSTTYPHSFVHFLPFVLLQIYIILTSCRTKGLIMLNRFCVMIILGRFCWIVGLILDCSQQGSPGSCSQHYFIHVIIMSHLAMLFAFAHG